MLHVCYSMLVITTIGVFLCICNTSNCSPISDDGLSYSVLMLKSSRSSVNLALNAAPEHAVLPAGIVEQAVFPDNTASNNTS